MKKALIVFCALFVIACKGNLGFACFDDNACEEINGKQLVCLDVRNDHDHDTLMRRCLAPGRDVSSLRIDGVIVWSSLDMHGSSVDADFHK